MLLHFSLSIIVMVTFTACSSPIAPLPKIEEINVHWMIPENSDGSITWVYTDDFGMMYSINGRLRINDKICREATK